MIYAPLMALALLTCSPEKTQVRMTVCCKRESGAHADPPSNVAPSAVKSTYIRVYYRTFDQSTFMPITRESIRYHGSLTVLRSQSDAERLKGLLEVPESKHQHSQAMVHFNEAEVRLLVEDMISHKQTYVDVGGSVATGTLCYKLTPAAFRKLKDYFLK